MRGDGIVYRRVHTLDLPIEGGSEWMHVKVEQEKNIVLDINK